MKCRYVGCPKDEQVLGTLSPVKRQDPPLVIHGITAEVCGACGEVLYTPKSSRRAEKLQRGSRGRRMARALLRSDLDNS